MGIDPKAKAAPAVMFYGISNSWLHTVALQINTEVSDLQHNTGVPFHYLLATQIDYLVSPKTKDLRATAA